MSPIARFARVLAAVAEKNAAPVADVALEAPAAESTPAADPVAA